jgi:RNA polymerase sigma-70 factor (ECF subfamily)
MDTNLDAQAVVAVKNGDRQRYRELVDRHERRVYAVAWSRLGDPDLAQEVTQETFIKGYRHLAFLNEDSRFGVWITAIARNAAISLGLRRRNELKNRQRWALTQMEDAQSADRGAMEEKSVSVETLRETLARLPAHHRECLVLFYLEGKGMAEAARALGLSETAFKTRLHRARGVLRERLEEQLEGSLGQLRPRHAVAPAIMAILATQKAEAAVAASGAGALVKVASGAGKLLPFQFTVIGMWLSSLVPGMLFNVWMHRIEQRNFHDPDGFRAQLHRRTLNRLLIVAPVLMAIIPLITGVAGFLLGRQGFMRVAGLMGLVWLLVMVRRFTIIWSRFEVYNFFAVGVLIVEFLASGFLGLSASASGPFFMGVFALLIGLAHRHLPRRMDYSLFLRASQNLVPECPGSEIGRTFTPKEVFAFGRFLGQRRLVVDYRRTRGGIRFCLAPVRPTVWKDGFSPFVWHNNSALTIPFDGSIQAALADRDLASLGCLQNGSVLDRAVLEERVARAVSHAFDAFLAGDARLAERSLGQQPDEEIFREPPERSTAARWRSGVMVGLGVLILGLAVYALWRDRFNFPTQGRRLKPVSLTENEVRHALAQLPLDDRETWQAFDYFLEYGGLTFPPKELFTAEAWEGVQQHTWSQVHRHGMKADPDPRRMLQILFDFQDFQRAVLAGIITLPELASQGITPSVVRDYLAGLSPSQFARLTCPQEIPVTGRNYTALEVEWLSHRLRVIQLFNCLDLVDAGPIITRLRAHQVIAGNSLEGRRPIPDRSLVQGLFHCLGSAPLRDTYHSLVILSLLGGLDRIDREACVAGILRFHHSKGLFGSFRKNDDLFFLGDAHDTFYAYESLRMLNALDRVKDLDQWRFRPLKEPPAFAGEPMSDVTWLAIEAWLYQQGLYQFIEARKQNPQLTPPSLQSLVKVRKWSGNPVCDSILVVEKSPSEKPFDVKTGQARIEACEPPKSPLLKRIAGWMAGK